MQTLREFIENNKNELYTLLRELCNIPASSYAEDARATYCQEWLENNGVR